MSQAEKRTIDRIIVAVAEGLIFAFMVTAILVFYIGVLSGETSPSESSLVLATLALSIATFLLARHSGALSEMEAKRIRRISIENSERTATKIMADLSLQLISRSISNGHRPASQYENVRELLENLPSEEKELKELARDILKAMDGAYGSEADRIVNAGKAQDLYVKLRARISDDASRWRREM